MKRVIVRASSRQERAATTAHRMYQDRQAAWEKYDGDEVYKELNDMMHEEAGSNWENYVPFAEMRRTARDAGYRVLKVRAKGAFPYYIDRK